MIHSLLRVGDLISLTSPEWSTGWRHALCIVVSTYPSVKIRDRRHRRWQVLAETGDLLVVIQDDVTVIQHAPNQ